MTAANEMDEALMQELSKLLISDAELETNEEEEVYLFHEDEASDEIPQSMLSYFDSLTSRAAVCEKLRLGDLEDLTAPHRSEDTKDLPSDPDEDLPMLIERVIGETENEESSSTSPVTSLPPAPTETEPLLTHNVSVCLNNEDEVEGDEYLEHLAVELRAHESSVKEEEEKKHTEYQAEREKRQREEREEEQRRLRERDFEEELRKIEEAEKLRQKDVEMAEKKAQDKLEQELLQQQELISNLQRQVEEERRREEEERKNREEEDKRRNEEERKTKEEEERKRQEEEEEKKKKREESKKRKKEEEENRKMAEERKKMEAERRKMEEEVKRKEEENRKREEEIRLKEEEERRKKEKDERKKRDEEAKRRKEEERITMEAERKKMEEETRRNKEEENRKREEEIRLKEDEEKRKKEEDERKKRDEEEKRKMEQERKTKDEEKTKRQEEKRKREEERIKMEAERKKMEEETRRKEEEEENRKREDERRLKEEKKKKEEDERKKRDEEEKRKIEQERKTKDEEKMKRQEEKRKREEERIKMEAERKKMEEEENRKREDEIRLKEEEKKKKEEETKTKDEEQRKRQEEGKKKREEENRKREDERRLKEEEERKKRDEEEKRKKEEERKTEDGEKRKRQEEENKKREEKNRKREGKKSVVEDQGKEERARRASEPQKRERENERTQNEKKKTDRDGGNSTETPGQKTRHTSICETVSAEEDPAASSSLPVCLPERTEQKRLSWMRDCTSWSKLSLQNRRKQRGPAQSRRGARRPPEGLPPLCPDALLRSGGCKSLQEVTTVRLEELPGCSLPSPAQCPQLRSLTLRRCGLKALEGISQFPQLCYIDVQENDITFVDCENMASLRVLRLGRNRLTSIHGLSGADNLDVLELSHNSITRIAGLESMKRLQRLSVDHNQLISTKGLREVYTLLHLDCSHNHLTSVEGLENCALLSTLDVRANNLTEAPGLKNQVLLRELRLDDNSISSLQGLAACWLPLLHHLSLAQNSITQLPSMSDCVSLVNLDLRHNCLSELRSVCESLEGCPLLREIHLTGNPLQQESGWRSTLQTAVPGLRTIDGQETIPSLSPPAVDGGGLPSDSFLAFCQAQLQQTHDLQQQHSRELSGASSPLDAVKTSCRHFTEALQLAEDQRFAHEYGDTTVSDTHRAADQTPPEETLHTDSTDATKLTEHPEMESPGNREAHTVPALSPAGDNGRSWTFEKSATERLLDTPETVTTGPKMELTVSKAKSGSSSSHSLATKEKKTPSNPRMGPMGPMSDPQKLDLKNTAAVVIQQHWKKHRQKCGNISRPPTAEKGGGRGGDGGKVASGPSRVESSVVGLDYAATVIQAFWRGFALRKRLASALAWAAAAAAERPDAGEEDGFEEVDLDEFVFDEAELEKDWTLLLSEDSPPRMHPVSDQPLSPKYIFPPPLPWRPKQAWVSGEQVDSAGQRVSPEGTNRTKSPASTAMLSGLSERSEKILEEWGFTDSHTALLMLKRARKMKSQKQRQKRSLLDPSVRLALFRNCTYQLGPVEAGKRPAPDKRDYLKVGEAELGLQQAEQVRLKQERTYQWLHSQAAPSDRLSESERFLPEIDPDVLNGGRVQLVSLPPLFGSLCGAAVETAGLGSTRKEVPSPQRVPSVPSKKERISYRDNPVQLSGGWGGGKKRDKVCK
ncbi:leucine-rich repeat- and IQ domain-containing protein 1 [Centroberyx affinis]|uniref:leucine-rich repeat- and IQ domain-containing protein 1 n=1 Tax=Centroberyx affinis TaxID=166261 RepID=UPI003A5BD775